MSSNEFIFLFPGQSSRDPEMFDRLAQISPEICKEILEHIALRFPEMEKLTEFQTNKAVQLAVFGVNLGYLKILQTLGIVPCESAGLSLGEYNHLAEIGVLNINSAFDLVAKRGEAYDKGPPGMMVATQALSVKEVEDSVTFLQEREQWSNVELAVVNYNSPGQCVVAGSVSAVAMFIDYVEQEYFAVPTIIEHNIPMHSPAFKVVGENFVHDLKNMQWQASARTYWPNLTASPLSDVNAKTFIDTLSRHVSEPVRWQHTIDSLAARYPDAIFIEVGAKHVLKNMLTRRWIDKARVLSVDDPVDFETIKNLCNAQKAMDVKHVAV